MGQYVIRIMVDYGLVCAHITLQSTKGMSKLENNGEWKRRKGQGKWKRLNVIVG